MLNEVEMLNTLLWKQRLSPVQVVALTLWGEARGEPMAGRIAVGNVIHNRAKHRAGSPHPSPTDWKKVCLQPHQFSCWEAEGGEANYEACKRLAQSLLTHAPITDTTWSPILALTLMLMNGEVGDTTHGADHYLTTALWTQRPPSWVRGLTPTAQIGRHVFFKLFR